ncbi:WhiB family transcriptional regulator [Streptomyces sp. NPDC006393]|uniref:WhiB family transcriptional regulator n=1 Tax=Streptomyces sp. NPDC006393 TaxID=3156763 RepID=UPI0033FD9364
MGWQSAAACAGLPPRIVFSKKVKEAAPALRACAGCTVRRHCEEAVAPADNWFDGVCGGRLWRSGRPVPLPAHLLPPAAGPHLPAARPHLPAAESRRTAAEPRRTATEPRRTAADSRRTTAGEPGTALGPRRGAAPRGGRVV